MDYILFGKTACDVVGSYFDYEKCLTNHNINRYGKDSAIFSSDCINAVNDLINVTDAVISS